MENPVAPTLLRQLSHHPLAIGSALAVGLVASHPILGTLLILAAPFIAIWSIVTLVLMVRRPRERRVRSVLLAVWGVAVTVPVTVHAYRAYAVRAQANTLAAAVESYRSQHGRWPASLAAVGLDDAAIEQRWRLWYRAEKNVPALYYRATLTVFESYTYDFERRKWQLLPD